MPSGDPQRTWFPEMVVRLRLKWHEGMSIAALIGLRDELDGMLRQIRTTHVTSRRRSLLAVDVGQLHVQPNRRLVWAR